MFTKIWEGIVLFLSFVAGLFYIKTKQQASKINDLKQQNKKVNVEKENAVNKAKVEDTIIKDKDIILAHVNNIEKENAKTMKTASQQNSKVTDNIEKTKDNDAIIIKV